MAITVPNTRQLSDETLEALRLRAWRACEMGWSQTTIATPSAWPRDHLPLWNAYLQGGLGALPVTAPADRLVRAGPLRRPNRHLQALIDQHTPSHWASPPRLDPPRRARPDPSRVPLLDAGADRGRVPGALGLHQQAAQPARPRPGRRRSPRVGGQHLPEIEAGPPGKALTSTGVTRRA